MSNHELKCEVIIYWRGEDNAFIAEAPELRGCLAGGATAGDALANASIVAGEWIEAARGLGRPVPEPKGRLLSV